jgi:transcriptional regulator with XRE-family HTH domain
MPPSVAREIEFLRRQLGLSQIQLASLIGRSQGQLANALRGHDPISGAATNRLREFLLQKCNSEIPILSIS